MGICKPNDLAGSLIEEKMIPEETKNKVFKIPNISSELLERFEFIYCYLLWIKTGDLAV